MSIFLERIGIIQKPFLKDVSCTYVSSVIDEIKNKKGTEGLQVLFDKLLHAHLMLDWDSNRLEKYLCEEHSWINAFLSGAIFEIGKDLIGDDNFYYHIGRTAIRPSRLQVSVARFFSVKSVFQLVEYANKSLNNVIALRVLGRAGKRNSIAISNECLPEYRKRIFDRMKDESLTRRWLHNDCQLTKGALEAIPGLFNKTPAILISEPECQGRGDTCCIYQFEWQPEAIAEKFGQLAKKIVTLDYHWEMKAKIRTMEVTIRDKTEGLRNANYDLEMANRELREMQAKLIETEKRTLEHRITGGFAHEMRNALAGAQLEFKTTLNYKDHGKPSAEILKNSATDLLKNISDLHEEYGIPREKIATLVLPQLKTIAEIADHLSGVYSDVSKDLDRGLSITTQIRDYARMSELKPGNTPIDIVEMLKGYNDRFRHDFQRIDIAYFVEGLNKAIVRAEEIHLDSIFGNLIRNAKDALEEYESDREKEIRITVGRKNDENGRFVTVEVSDNGPGIPEEHLNEIFEPFFSTKPSSGTGLGLGIVKRLVQLYKGKIEMESVVGEGTTISVTLPKAQE